MNWTGINKSGGNRNGWFLFGALRHSTVIETNRDVEKRNGRNAFFAKKGDTYEDIAAEFSLKEEEILKYNDTEKGNEPETGL